MSAVFIVLCLFYSVNSFAVEEGAGPPDLEIMSVVASLLLVLVCIFVFAYLMKHSSLLTTVKGKSQIKIVSTQPLGSKGRVQLIEINDRQYLLGVTEQNITLLDKFAKPLIAEKAPDQKAPTTAFSTLLSKISNKTDE